jgi:hypothetical protein
LKPGPSEPVLSHALSTDSVPLPDEQQGLRAVALLFNTRLRAWSDDTAQPPDVPASPGRSACAAHNWLRVIRVMAFVEQGTAALWAAADADTLYALCDFGVLGDAQVIRLPSGSGLLCSAAWFILCAACGTLRDPLRVARCVRHGACLACSTQHVALCAARFVRRVARLRVPWQLLALVRELVSAVPSLRICKAFVRHALLPRVHGMDESASRLFLTSALELCKSVTRLAYRVP